MNYQVRNAEKGDFPAILEIYASARRFMAESGNPNQWGNADPSEAVLRHDLGNHNLYVLTEGGKIHGVFAFISGWEDPTYQVIERGSWHSTGPYGVIHRVAGDGSGGILRAAVSYAEQRAAYLRIDTHEDNLPMQRQIRKNGFSYCGIIYTEKGDPRLAFDRVPGKNAGKV